LPAWKEEEQEYELEIVRHSGISELVIETDVLVTVYDSNEVDLELLACFPALQNFQLYMTNLDQGMPHHCIVDEIWEIDKDSGNMGDFVLDLDQLGLMSTTVLTIQPFHDRGPDFMKKVSLLSLDTTNFETLTIPQANLLGQTLPQSLRTLGISEPTIEVWGWLNKSIAGLDAFPRLETIIIYSLDSLFTSLPGRMKNTCEERGLRSLTLLLHAPQTFRVAEGGTSIALKG
jgi:hypothetical protein